MNVHQLPLVLGLVLVIAGGALLALVDSSMPQVRDPRIPADEGVKRVRLQVRPIQEFAHYYGSEVDPWQDLNPFVPFSQREAEREQLVNRRRQRNQKDDPETVAELPTLPPPPQRQEPVAKPQLQPLPTLSGSEIATPQVVGYLSGPSSSSIKVRFGDGPALGLQPGDSHAGWTFIEVRGGTAFFLDEEGVEHGFFVSDPVSGVTTLGTLDHLSGGGSGGPGATPGGGAIPDLSTLPEGMQGVADILRQIQDDPRGAAMLQANPDLRQMLEDNPERALNLFERLRARQTGQRGR